MTVRSNSGKDPFETYRRSWQDYAKDPLFTLYGSGQTCGTRSDFEPVETEEPTSFEERIMPTHFAHHTLRALLGAFENGIEDESMHEKFMLGYFVTYRHLLRDYTKRNLTKPGDVLRAWSGIATLFSRFAHGKEVICGLPTAAMDLAILWTPVGDALGSRKERSERAEVDKDYYPTWSWTSMTDPIDLLMSQRWTAKGEGLAELLEEKKQDKQLMPEDKPEAAWAKFVQSGLKITSKLDLGFAMEDDHPFQSEVTWIGVQDGYDFIEVLPDPDICPSSASTKPPAVDMVIPPPATEILHFEADIVPLKSFLQVGGRVITTTTRSWYSDIEEVMKQSAGFSLIRSFYSYFIQQFTNAPWQEWRQIVPDRDQKELLNNMGFVYDELTLQKLLGHPRNPELVQDYSKIYVVALSRIRAFPPTTFYWQYLDKRLGSWLTPRKFREWDLVGDPWKTRNVMLVKYEEGGLTQRICVGHVNAKCFEKAEPERKYIRLC